MRWVFLLILVIPVTVYAQLQHADSVRDVATKRIHIQGFVQTGYVNELWILSANLNHSYASLSYTGKGGYIGCGFKSATDNKHPVGFGLSADYLGYAMDKSLTTNELAQSKYAFVRFTPAIYLRIKTKSVFTINWCATGSMLLAAHARENNYYQLGIKACIGYEAFGLDIGYSFSKGQQTPSTLISTDSWREQQFYAGLVCYPSRLDGWGKLKAKIKNELKSD